MIKEKKEKHMSRYFHIIFSCHNSIDNTFLTKMFLNVSRHSAVTEQQGTETILSKLITINIKLALMTRWWGR